MSKKILQDIITSNRHVRRSGFRDNEIKTTKHIISENIQKITYGPNKKNKSSKFIMWFLALASSFFLLFVLLSVFSGTIVEVAPVQVQVSLNDGLLKVKKDASGNELSFKMIILENTDSTEVPATEEKELQRKASGDIIIYNTYSSKSQKLIVRTRFETPTGEIYRIKKSVIVPGTTVQNGEIVPGSVEVTVYADVPGEEYNVGLVDFTVPGFKGDPRFSKFYARSKTPIEGGFSGVIKFASSEDVENALDDIANSLKEVLLSQARSEVPDDFILYDKAVFFEFDDVTPQKETAKGSISITEEGKLYGVIFNKTKLSKYIAEKFINPYEGEDVVVRNLDELEFKIIDQEKFDPKNTNELRFEFSGIADIVWEVDNELLVNSIVGKNKEDFNDIISKYSSVDKAKATIRPFWKKIFPENNEDITIKIIKPSNSLD